MSISFILISFSFIYLTISFSEALSSFALLDSKILAPPNDPEDIFGMGDNFSEQVFGMTIIHNNMSAIYL